MKLNLIVIRTNDIKRLAEFYQKLGLTFEYHRHGKGSWHYSTIIGEIVFEIYPLLKSQTTVDNSLRLGFTVEDLDKLLEDLKENQVEIVNLPQYSEYGYFAVIKDLDGRKIELKQK